MEQSNFKLKNSHRVAALKLAISLINEAKLKPLYEQRHTLVQNVSRLSHLILEAAAEPFSGIGALAEAGVCTMVDSLELGRLTDQFLGVASLNPEFNENWHVVTDNSARQLVTLCNAPAGFITLPGKVASFASSNWRPSGHLVPVASLSWVLAHGKALPSPRSAMVAGLVDEVVDQIAPELTRGFDSLPEIVKVIGSCASYADLVRAFPAASSLFEAPKPTPPAHSPAALNLLHSIS